MSPLDVIEIPGRPGMYARRRAVEAWQRAGSPWINSAGRLYAEQKRAWDAYQNGTGSPADNPDDPNQRLAHVRFIAFDIDPTPDRIRRLAAAGMIRPYSYEPWHWELPNVYSYGLVWSIPAPTPTPLPPLPEGKTMSDVQQIHYVENGRIAGRALIVPGTAWAIPWVEAGSTYANRAAEQFETGNSIEYTKSVFYAFLAAAARCAPTSLSIEVEASVPDEE